MVASMKITLFISFLLLLLLAIASNVEASTPGIGANPSNTRIDSMDVYDPYLYPLAVPGDVGPDASCAVTSTSFIASAPPDVWANGGACGRYITVACVSGIDQCSGSLSTTVQIVDLSCTDCEEMFYLSKDAFFTIAAANAAEISISYATT